MTQKRLPQNGYPRMDLVEVLSLKQLFEVFERLSKMGTKYEKFGDLCAIDGSLIDATLSMEWADYTSTTNKAKVHLSLDLNSGLPRKIILTEGKAPERPVALDRRR